MQVEADTQQALDTSQIVDDSAVISLIMWPEAPAAPIQMVLSSRATSIRTDGHNTKLAEQDTMLLDPI